jgi:hypothetical protein
MCVFPAFAAAITVSPQSIRQGDTESFLTIDGTTFPEGEGVTLVDISGPAGTFTLAPSSFRTTRTGMQIDVFIPIEVASTAGHYSVTVRVQEAAGVRTDGPASFDVLNNVVPQPPLIGVPEAVQAEAQDASGAIVTFTVTSVSFVDASAVVTCNPPSGSRFPIGPTVVTCRATDSFGSASASFPVQVSDTTPPVITVPGTINTNDPVVTYSASAVDNLDGPVAVSCSPASGSTFPFGISSVTCTAQDSRSNFSSATFQVIVHGSTPILTVPNDFNVEATSSAGAVVTYSATADTGTVSCTSPSGSTFPLGLTHVTCTAIAPGGSASASFNVTVVDNTPPTLILPSNLTAGATSAAGATVAFTATSRDLVDGDSAAVCSPASGSLFPIGVTTVQCTGSDLHGHFTSGSFNVTVTNATPPTLTLPANITKEATGPNGAAVTYVATATDLIDGTVPVICTPLSGSTFAIATTTVQCVATNSSGKSANGSFTVTVRDTTGPALTIPNVVAEATSSAGAKVTYNATANDLVDGSVANTCTPASGSQFAFGITSVQCTAVDSRGNRSNGTFSVTVRDTTPPVVTVPGTITIEALRPQGMPAVFTASARDNIDGALPVRCQPPSGSNFPIGTNPVQCSATDAHGNIGTASFNVVVRDTLPPFILVAIANPSVITKSDNSLVNVTVSVIAFDFADSSPNSKITSVTFNQPAGTQPDYVITGPLTVQLRATRTGGRDRTYSLNLECTDNAGNKSIARVTVRVGAARHEDD